MTSASSKSSLPTEENFESMIKETIIDAAAFGSTEDGLDYLADCARATLLSHGVDASGIRKLNINDWHWNELEQLEDFGVTLFHGVPERATGFEVLLSLALKQVSLDDLHKEVRRSYLGEQNQTDRDWAKILTARLALLFVFGIKTLRKHGVGSPKGQHALAWATYAVNYLDMLATTERVRLGLMWLEKPPAGQPHLQLRKIIKCMRSSFSIPKWAVEYFQSLKSIGLVLGSMFPAVLLYEWLDADLGNWQRSAIISVFMFFVWYPFLFTISRIDRRKWRSTPHR